MVRSRHDIEQAVVEKVCDRVVNTIYNELLALCNNFSNQERTRQHKKRKQTVQGPPTNKRQRVVSEKEVKQGLRLLKVRGYTFSVVHRRAIGFGLLIDWLVKKHPNGKKGFEVLETLGLSKQEILRITKSGSSLCMIKNILTT